MSGAEICDYEWLGRVEYLEAWEYQQELALRRARGEIADRILMVEHPPVFTTGRRGPARSCRGHPIGGARVSLGRPRKAWIALRTAAREYWRP